LDLTAQQSPSKIMAAQSSAAAEPHEQAASEAVAKKDDINNEEELPDNIDEQYGEDDLINEIYNMN
jgi:hypothetical protein